MNNYYSTVFWHFTGSPKGIDWENINCPKEFIVTKKPKSVVDSIDVLKSILNDKKLNASCTERIIASKKTENFCCVTDIPLKDLENHSKYYGKVAIGFSSRSIYNCFNPVLYIPRRIIINKLTQTKESIEKIPEDELINMGCDKGTALRSGYIDNGDGTYNVPVSSLEIKENTDLEKHLLSFLKSTEYSDKEGESFYQEREWRKIDDFCFDSKDVVGVIVPQKFIKEINKYLSSNDFKNVNILSWEFIEKS